MQNTIFYILRPVVVFVFLIFGRFPLRYSTITASVQDSDSVSQTRKLICIITARNFFTGIRDAMSFLCVYTRSSLMTHTHTHIHLHRYIHEQPHALLICMEYMGKRTMNTRTSAHKFVCIFTINKELRTHTQTNEYTYIWYIYRECSGAETEKN